MKRLWLLAVLASAALSLRCDRTACEGEPSCDDVTEDQSRRPCEENEPRCRVVAVCQELTYCRLRSPDAGS